jgi:hypothetical protein
MGEIMRACHGRISVAGTTAAVNRNNPALIRAKQELNLLLD